MSPMRSKGLCSCVRLFHKGRLLDLDRSIVVRRRLHPDVAEPRRSGTAGADGGPVNADTPVGAEDPIGSPVVGLVAELSGKLRTIARDKQ